MKSIYKTKFGEKTEIDYDEAIDHIADRLTQHEIGKIVRLNSDGCCERSRMSDRRRAAIIVLRELTLRGWVMTDDCGDDDDNWRNAGYFGLEIGRDAE